MTYNTDNANTTTDTMTTRRDERVGTPKIETVVTFDWSNVTTEDYRNMATAWAKIKLQIGWRKNGIPSEAKVNVKDIVPGTRAPRGPVDPIAIAQRMTPEELTAYIATLHAMAAKK